MNWVVILNSFDYGSTGNLCVSLKKYQSLSANNRTLMICGNKSKNNKADYYVSNKNNIFIRYAIAHNVHFLRKIAYAITTHKVLSFIQKKINFKNDKVIFHYHNMQYSYLDIKILSDYAKKKGIKTVLTAHDCWPITGGCNHFLANDCNEWENKSNTCKFCKYGFKKCVDNLKRKQNCFKDSIIISPSKWLDNVINKSILSNTNHIVINNGIDTKFWNYDLFDKKNCTKINLIAVASPWSKLKGLDYLNELALLLPSNYCLRVVGLKETQHLNPKIENYGRLEKEELRALYSSSHIFINPTLEDNFPTVNIEAQLCGCYICSFDTGGSKEIFSKDTGMITSSKSSQSMMEAIKSIYLNDAVYSKCRLNALKYDLESFNQKYFEIYNKLFM